MSKNMKIIIIIEGVRRNRSTEYQKLFLTAPHIEFVCVTNFVKGYVRAVTVATSIRYAYTNLFVQCFTHPPFATA